MFFQSNFLHSIHNDCGKKSLINAKCLWNITYRCILKEFAKRSAWNIWFRNTLSLLGYSKCIERSKYREYWGMIGI